MASSVKRLTLELLVRIGGSQLLANGIIGFTLASEPFYFAVAPSARERRKRSLLNCPVVSRRTTRALNTNDENKCSHSDRMFSLCSFQNTIQVDEKMGDHKEWGQFLGTFREVGRFWSPWFKGFAIGQEQPASRRSEKAPCLACTGSCSC